MGFDMDPGLIPGTPQNINNMDYYKNYKSNNLKFPITKEMFDYYFSLGLDCFVIKYYTRIDGYIYVLPGILSPQYDLLDCIDYDFCDREDIRAMLSDHAYGHFKKKYEKRCKEMFKRRMYSCPINSING